MNVKKGKIVYEWELVTIDDIFLSPKSIWVKFQIK